MGRKNFLARWASLCLAIFVFTALPTGFSSGGVSSTAYKMGPRLRALLRAPQNHSLTRPTNRGPMVPLFIQTEGNKSLRDLVGSLGGRLGTEVNGWATADVPLNQIPQLAEFTAVRYLEVSPQAKPVLDSSRVRIEADRAQRGDPPLSQAYTGKGVIIGIIDTGIDIHHPDFQHPDSTTRILSIWDQTEAGTFPSGFLYGREWTQQDINTGLCTEKDTKAHGTHVAGIAAGNGRGDARYRGIAPEADLIVVKTDFTFSHIIDGIQYVFNKAKALGKPAVVNLSLSTQQGPHDGTSTPAQMIEGLIGPGRIVVSAASNEGDTPIHTGFTVQSGQVYGTKFQAQTSSTETIELDIWYSSASALDFSIGAYDASGNWLDQTVWVTPGAELAAAKFKAGTQTYGIVTIDASETSSPLNGDHHVYVEISSDNGRYNISKNTVTWALLVRGGGRFDAWLYSEDCEFLPETILANNVQFIQGNSQSTVGTPATSDAVISVGAFQTKNTWQASDGGTYFVQGNIGQLASFSSRGPTRDGRIKPDLCAPGQVIASALSADADLPTTAPHLVLPGNQYFIAQGTSMAAPHAAGSVALLLQQTPDLTPAQALARLISSAETDGYTGTTPNNGWGAGKLNIFAALSTTVSRTRNADRATPPAGWQMLAAFPNPASLAGDGGVTIVWRSSPHSGAELAIFDLMGRKVRRLQIAVEGRDLRKSFWDGRNQAGFRVPAGIYFARLRLKGAVLSRKILLLR